MGHVHDVGVVHLQPGVPRAAPGSEDSDTPLQLAVSAGPTELPALEFELG